MNIFGKIAFGWKLAFKKPLNLEDMVNLTARMAGYCEDEDAALMLAGIIPAMIEIYENRWSDKFYDLFTALVRCKSTKEAMAIADKMNLRATRVNAGTFGSKLKGKNRDIGGDYVFKDK